MTPRNGAVVELVRQALDQAAAAGQPRPGRPTLARITGAKEHQVRQALAKLKDPATSEHQEPASPDDHTPPAAGDPSPGSQAGDHQAPAATAMPPADQPPGDRLVVEPASTEATSPPAHQPTATSSASEHQAPRTHRPWPLILIGLAAAVAVWGGWVDLGRLTGFGMVQPLPGLVDGLWINSAIVLPIGIEAYGGYALRTWLSSAALSDRTRRYARWSALASLAVGAGAQVASHLMRAANVTTAPWQVTVLVACVPVAVLGLATGLATLVRRDTNPGRPGGDL